MSDSAPPPASPERRVYDVQVVPGETVWAGAVLRSDRGRRMRVEGLQIRPRIGWPLDPLIVAVGTASVVDEYHPDPIEYESSACFYPDDLVVIDR